MPSLNLRNPLRRDPNRPTLKQRAATLKATAARLMRREGPDTAAEASAAPVPDVAGFKLRLEQQLGMPVSVKTGLQIEARKLLSIAQDEFSRLYAAQSQGLDEPGREMAAACLRRALRIDALTMAADPVGDAHAGGTHADLTMMTGGVVDDDGRVTFCDASGRVLRKPVADWIRFTAARLYHQAQAEYARQLNGSDLDQDGMQALARELRRALRMDALSILAFRSATACDVAEAAEANTFSGPIPAPSFPGAGVVSPDLLRAVEAHREACLIVLNDPNGNDERTGRGAARVYRLAQVIRDVPARSMADLRHKMIYLWPGSLEGETVSPGLDATFASFKEDVARLASGNAPAPDADLSALEAEFLAAKAACDAAWERLSHAEGGYEVPPMPAALRVWRNDWFNQYLPRTPTYTIRGRAGVFSRPYGCAEVEKMRGVRCMRQTYRGDGEESPNGGFWKPDEDAQSRVDAIVAAWDAWQADIQTAREAANLPELEAARETAMERRDAILVQIRDARASSVVGLGIKARAALSMAGDVDLRREAANRDASDSNGLLYALAADVLDFGAADPAASTAGPPTIGDGITPKMLEAGRLALEDWRDILDAEALVEKVFQSMDAVRRGA